MVMSFSLCNPLLIFDALAGINSKRVGEMTVGLYPGVIPADVVPKREIPLFLFSCGNPFINILFDNPV
jgi:hypothetical protein